MRRWATRTAVAAAVLLALYSAAGYLLAPRLVRDALVDEADARGLALGIGRVRTDPFRFAVALEGVELRGLKDIPLASAQAAHADLAWASLWRDAWLVEEAGISGGSLEYRNGKAQARLEDMRAVVRSLTVGAGTPAPYEISAVAASGGTLRAQGTLSLEPFALRGTLAAEAISLENAWALAAPAVEPVPGRIAGTLAYAYEKGAAVLRDVAVRIEPRAGGRLAAAGHYDLGAARGRLKLDAEALPLSLVQRFLPKAVAVASGAVSSSGTLDLDAKPLYAGSLRVQGLRLEERGSGRVLLGWQRGETPRAQVSGSGASLGAIELQAPHATLVVEPGGVLNFARLFGGRAGREGPGFRIAFERLSLAEGRLDFTDRSLDTPFRADVVALRGSVTGFSTEPGDPAKVLLNGRVQPYGSARIRGTIDAGAPTSLADITAELRNLRLQAFSPYAAKFAGYRIADGRLSADLRYELRDGRLAGHNNVVFEEMRLGEKVTSPSAFDLPLELAVALLADAKGRITLDIPVRGDLRDPEFEFGAIVARAVGNTLQRIVTAPFRALAGLFGGSADDLGRIAFRPGSEMLSPPAEEAVAKIAAALEARPLLAVSIQGGYDPAADVEALKLRTARREVAKGAGADEAKGALDFKDAKVLQAAERLYLQRAGNRLDLLKLRRDAGEEYGRALLERLAATVPADEASAATLAQARAEAVRAALLARGVDAARVRVEDVKARATGEEGVTTELSLASRR